MDWKKSLPSSQKRKNNDAGERNMDDEEVPAAVSNDVDLKAGRRPSANRTSAPSLYPATIMPSPPPPNGR
jgi:hypothetical protein